MNNSSIADPEAVPLFLRPEYLQPLIDSGCAAHNTGWTPLPELAPAPVWEKSHSWGEFVFDQPFARAYAQHGLRYYPKWVCAIPFTPVPGPRLFHAERARRATDLAAQRGASGVHALFVTAAEATMLAALGWLRREQPRYVWHNRGYAAFEDFLAALNSKRRKNLRAERRAVARAGLRIEWRASATLDEDEWRQVYALYAHTYAVRGQAPYLALDCLQAWARGFPQALQFCLAHDAAGIAAMAFFFEDGDALYGRHWGSRLDQPGLHFELCCYQGIDRADARGLQRFDAGVQGEHKLLRGFSPEASLSMHWIAHEGFRSAIADYLQRERAAVRQELAALAEHDGYRQL
jgi:uncharacterized protein